VRLHVDDAPAEIYLKLENLQPIGSFKIRGAYNAMTRAPRDELAAGVVTASAGNMAQGVAWAARELGAPCTVIVPDHAPQTKLAAIERLGGSYVKVSFDRWWQALEERGYPGVKGVFVHPVEDEPVMAGNGTIGLEIVEDLPDPDVVIVPWGGGGLLVGIASAVKALRPATEVRAVELETAAPLTASLAAGEPREIDYRASFVDGAGARAVLPKMWDIGRRLARRDRGGRAAPGRARPRDRGGSGRAGRRRRPLRAGRRRQDRLHRLRRQHRRRSPGADPLRRDALTP
jgi:threonine dehydratase